MPPANATQTAFAQSQPPASGVAQAFGFASTTAGRWRSDGSCLTAGTSATPAGSIPSCNGSAPADADGTGALQLTTAAAGQTGFAMLTRPVPTAGGLQVTFTPYAFAANGSGGDGLTLFLADATQSAPSTAGGSGGSLGYANRTNARGLTHGYLAVALDESGFFSAPSDGRAGGPGRVPQTVAIRGSASTGYAYLGGFADAQGKPAPLPFALATNSPVRPGRAPAFRVTLSAAGLLTVAVDRHDGAGFTELLSQRVVGRSGQGPVPASLYVGFTAATGKSFARHQIGSIAVAPIDAQADFTPSQIDGLSAWFDANDDRSLTLDRGAVVRWNDKATAGRALSGSRDARAPVAISAGLGGRTGIEFTGEALGSGYGQLSAQTFDASTTFVIAGGANASEASILRAGAPGSTAPLDLRVSERSASFAFDPAAGGTIAAPSGAGGPTLWTAEGSVREHVQFLRRNGSVVALGLGPARAGGGDAPLTVGGGYTGRVGEILIFDRALSAAESTQIEGYLACKWGLQNQLPADHPYHDACPAKDAPLPAENVARIDRAQNVATATAAAPAPSQPATAAPSTNASRTVASSQLNARTSASGATELGNPPQISSSGGTLTFNVTAQAGTGGAPQFSYNGSSIPPTLRLTPGDTLVVNYTNNLPTPPTGAGYTNATNLHYHGLHVSPQNGSDDEIDMLAQPGQTLHYTIAIPASHPPGLYWYHTHAHGESERQTLSGMSGALIIEGISQYAPATASVPERVIVMRDTITAGQVLPNADQLQLNAMRWAMSHAAYSAKTGSEVRGKSTTQTQNPYVVVDPSFRRIAPPVSGTAHCTGPETAFRNWTVNGLTQPAIGIKPGETQFWRMVNAGADTYLDVQIDNAPMQIVALDGVPLSSGVNTPSSLTVGHWVLPPASRVEFLVKGPPSGAPVSLRTNCVDAGPAGVAMPAAVLASIDPTTSLSTNVVAPRRVLPNVTRTTASRVRALRAAAQASGTLVQQSVTYSDQNTINGVAYNPGGPPLFYAQSGTVQEWTVINNSQQLHTFHIHQIHFIVEAINGVSQAQQYVMDNVNVPAATANGPGTVKLLLDFTDPLIVGTFLVHCHILSHEDAGMMAKIRVGTSPPLALSVASASFYSPTAPAQTVTLTGGTAPYSVTGCSGVATATVNGSVVSISPAAAGGCLLIVSDSSGLTATIPISVQGVTSPISLVPNIAGFASATAPAQKITMTGGTVPYSASGCNGVASVSIANTTLTVSPVAVGTCSVIVIDAKNNRQTLSVSVNGTSGGNPQDNVTFHQNNLRTGWYASETALTTTNVASTSFGLIKTLTAPAGSTAFGKVMAQPLYVSGETAADNAKHNLVIVATTTDQVYAFDDQTFNVVWHRDFTNAAAGITQQSWTDTGCTDLNPDIGIVGTPTIDRALDRLYVAVPTKENGTFHLRLHAISLKSGLEAVDANNVQVGPTEISGTATLTTGGSTSIDAKYNFQRPALLEANGNIYVGLGSHCDYNAGGTHGWMMAYNATTLQPSGNAILTDANDGSSYYLGAPWMSGFGPAADGAGNVYFATGNGPWNGKTNFSMTVLKVPGTLNLAGVTYFTPASEANDSAGDADLGSGGVMLFPDQTQGTAAHLAIQGGKTGVKWLLNRDNMGGQQTGDAGSLWHQNTGGGIWGGPAYFADAAGNQYVVYGTGSPLSTYKLGFNPYSLTVATSANVGCLECRDAGSQPIVSSNGTTAGTAVVWALKTSGNSGGPIALYAFDGLNMNHTLFNGTAGQWTIGAGAGNIGGALISPVVANGRVYVPVDGAVAVFGLH